MADRVKHALHWIDNAVKAQTVRTDPKNEELATAYAAIAQAHATLALVEQQRIANLIALASHAAERFGNYAGEAGGLATLFEYGETPESNMRLRDDIKKGLGL